MKNTLFISAVMGALSASIGSAETTKTTFNDWTLLRIAEGDQVWCLAGVTDDTREALIYLGNQETKLVFKLGYELPAGDHSVVLSIDGTSAFTFTGNAEGDALSYTVPAGLEGDILVKELSTGSELRLLGSLYTEIAKFSLNGTSSAFAEMRKCNGGGPNG